MLVPMRDLKPIRTVAFPDGTSVPALGMGTWTMGEYKEDARREVAALRRGLDLGLTVIDTAEMYADGHAEQIVARALAGRRDQAFIVSKVYPHNAGRHDAIAACERSLQRLKTDRVDLYLLHWRGNVPLEETVDAFERLRQQGKILRWGVSNFDASDLAELAALPEGHHCATNQVLYNLHERGIEWKLLEQCRMRQIPVMAYAPLAQGALAVDIQLEAIAKPLRLSAAQLALAWVLHRPGVIALAQSSSRRHVTRNRLAAGVELSATTLGRLDAFFAPPAEEQSLAVI